MATVTWTGSTGDGLWDTNANWLGGSKPSAGDDVIFDRGAYNVTTGPASAIALTSLTVFPTYTGSWTVDITLSTITTLSVSGSGGTYKLAAPVTTGYAYLAAGVTLVASSSTWATMYVSGTNGGKFYVNGATITSLYSSGVLVEFSAGGSASTTVQISSGSFRTAKNPGTLTCDGNCSVVVTGSSAVTTAVIGKGCVYNHQSSGTITTLTMKPGSSFPCIGTFSSFTITTLNLWPGASINRHPPGATVAIGTENSFGMTGGMSGDGP